VNVLVAPDPASFPSGGNRYNRLLMTDWARLGLAFRQMDWLEWKKSRFAEADSLFFDSLYFDELAALTDFFDRPGEKFFLLHYLSSFYPRDEDLLKSQLKVLEGFDAVICTGEAVFKELAVLNPSLSLRFHPPGQSRPSSWRRAEAEGGENAVLWVCSLQAVKGVLPMLQALKSEAKALRDRGVEVWMVGSQREDDAYARRCRILLDELAKEGVLRHWGALPHEDLQALYARARLLLSVSLFETFGMAVQEACLWSLPVWALEADYLHWHKRRGEVRVFPSVLHLAKALTKL